MGRCRHADFGDGNAYATDADERPANEFVRTRVSQLSLVVAQVRCERSFLRARIIKELLFR